MRALLLSLILTILLTLAFTMSAAADYTSPFGNHYTDEQVAQFCAALRPGSAAWVRYDCGNV